MTNQEITVLMDSICECDLHTPDGRRAFSRKIAYVIEDAIADNDRAVIYYLVTADPIERYFLYVAIEYGLKRNPDAQALFDMRDSDREYADFIKNMIGEKCKTYYFCKKPDDCTVIVPDFLENIKLSQKQIRLYKWYCRVTSSPIVESEDGL